MTRLLLPSCILVAACSLTEEQVDKETARELAAAKADSHHDSCAEYQWYGDGECDEFCPNPDPDCEPEAPDGPDLPPWADNVDCLVATTVCVGGAFAEPTFVSGCARTDEGYYLDALRSRTQDNCLESGGTAYRHYFITQGGQCGAIGERQPPYLGGSEYSPGYWQCPSWSSQGPVADEPMLCIGANTHACYSACRGKVAYGETCDLTPFDDDDDAFSTPCACPPWPEHAGYPD